MAHSTTIAVIIVLTFAALAVVFTHFFRERERGLFSFGVLVLPFGKSAQWLVCFSTMILAFYIIGPHTSPVPSDAPAPPKQQQTQKPSSVPSKKAAQAKKSGNRMSKAPCRNKSTKELRTKPRG